MSQVAPLSGVKAKVTKGAQSLASSEKTAKSEARRMSRPRPITPSPRCADDRSLTGQHRRDKTIHVTVHASVDRAHTGAIRAWCPLTQVKARAEVIAFPLQMDHLDGLVTGRGVHRVGQRVHDGDQ